MRSNQRKIYFIKKDFQSRFILRFVAIATVWAAGTVLLFAYLAEKRLEIFRFSSHVNVATTSDLLLPITLGTHGITLLLFALFLVYSIHALWKSLSTPLSSLKKDIASLANGDLRHAISLRESDKFNDLAIDLERMRRGLSEKIVQLSEQQRELTGAAAKLSGAIASGNAAVGHADALHSVVERMRKELKGFQS